MRSHYMRMLPGRHPLFDFPKIPQWEGIHSWLSRITVCDQALNNSATSVSIRRDYLLETNSHGSESIPYQPSFTPQTPRHPEPRSSLPLLLSCGTHDRAHSSLARAGHIRVSSHLALVVPDLRLGHRANGVVGLAFGGGVVGREDGGDGADDGTDLIVHLLGLGFIDDGLQGRALLCVHRGGAGLGVCGKRDRGVLGQVGVVVRL